MTERFGPAVAGGEGGPLVPMDGIRSRGLFMDSIDCREVIECVVEPEVTLGAVGGTNCSCRLSGWFDFAGGGLTMINVCFTRN